MNQPIIWKSENNIGHLILNDPPANKMNQEFFCMLTSLVNNVIPKSNVKAVVIYGSGRHFSQGADLKDLLAVVKDHVKTDSQGNVIQYPDFLIENNKSFFYFRKLNVPVIAAIKGVCLGSAFELALFCDIKIAGDNAVFGFPESTFNLMPGCGGTQNILNHLNYSKAMEILLTGETFDAATAFNLNLVDAVVPKKSVVDRALEIAQQIAERSK